MISSDRKGTSIYELDGDTWKTPLDSVSYYFLVPNMPMKDLGSHVRIRGLVKSPTYRCLGTIINNAVLLRRAAFRPHRPTLSKSIVCFEGRFRILSDSPLFPRPFSFFEPPHGDGCCISATEMLLNSSRVIRDRTDSSPIDVGYIVDVRLEFVVSVGEMEVRRDLPESSAGQPSGLTTVVTDRCRG
jgi:hypothetical protein